MSLFVPTSLPMTFTAASLSSCFSHFGSDYLTACFFHFVTQYFTACFLLCLSLPASLTACLSHCLPLSLPAFLTAASHCLSSHHVCRCLTTCFSHCCLPLPAPLTMSLTACLPPADGPTEQGSTCSGRSPAEYRTDGRHPERTIRSPFILLTHKTY